MDTADWAAAGPRGVDADASEVVATNGLGWVFKPVFKSPDEGRW